MKIVNLSGQWDLYYFPQGQIKVENPEQLETSGLKRIAAKVPGNVELDLVEAGELNPDLYFGENIRSLKPYELYEWWYQKDFDIPDWGADKQLELVFHGVDCIATYWLNGKLLGYSANMFIEHRFDISEAVVIGGTNRVVVRLQSPVIHAMEKDYYASMWALPTNWEQLWIRKAAHSWGWDIMPRVVSAGLWRRVELQIHDEYEIEDLYIYTRSIEKNTAYVGVHYQLNINPDCMEGLSIRVQGKCGDFKFEKVQKVFFKAGVMDIEVENPQLWWPRGYGDPNLYEVSTELLYKDKVLAKRQDYVGIRTVELERTDVTTLERPGEFLFKINNTPVFCKGSNWVPADVFHSRDTERIPGILELFKDLQCNMIRCWGGSVYEDHEFYSFCDREGIMIWQDFAMACAIYPQTAEFLETMRQEAWSVVCKLRSHPSIILWSGDNECDEFYSNRGLDPAENRITREVLPQMLSQCDPFRPYLPSSPYYSPEAVSRGNVGIIPEQHLWEPRDYYKSSFYSQTQAHFISEIGYHGCPNLSSIRKFIDEDHLWPWENNPQWVIHSSDPVGEEGPFAHRIRLMADQIHELFGFYPDNLEDFILASQISQAEANKFFIEMMRIKKWRRSGILWWNAVDGWPQFSDAVVDYYFGKKLAYHYIKRVQQPVCIMVDEPDSWHVRVVVGNDSLTDVHSTYRVWDADTHEVVMEGCFDVGANENLELGRIRISHGDKRLFLMEWTINGQKYGNHYMLSYPPVSFEKYKGWMKKIADLYPVFDAEKVGK